MTLKYAIDRKYHPRPQCMLSAHNYFWVGRSDLKVCICPPSIQYVDILTPKDAPDTDIYIHIYFIILQMNQPALKSYTYLLFKSYVRLQIVQADWTV